MTQDILFALITFSTWVLMALGARYRIRDAPRLMIPAASLAVLNAILVFLFTAR